MRQKIIHSLKQARLELSLARLSLATVGNMLDRIERATKRPNRFRTKRQKPLAHLVGNSKKSKIRK